MPINRDLISIPANALENNERQEVKEVIELFDDRSPIPIRWKIEKTQLQLLYRKVTIKKKNNTCQSIETSPRFLRTR